MARTTPPPSHEPSSTPTRELVASFYAHLTTLDQLLPASVVRQDDTEAYKRLLRLSLVGSQKEVVLRVDEESERAGQEMSVKENVSGNQNYVHYSGVALMSKFPNTTVSHLCDSLEWYTLLTRIGHGPLHTLFSNPTTARRKLVHSTSAPLLEGGRPSSPITSPVKSRSMLRPTQSVGLLGMRGVKRGRKEDDTKGRPRKVKKEAVLSEEIREKSKGGRLEIPKRLEGVVGLLAGMLRLEKRCKYRALLERFCPSKVTAYVQAVVQSVIPRDFWGSPANERLILQHIKTFVRFRRYETFSIHALLQGFSIADCDWLRPKSGKEERNREQKANEVEMERRKGLLADFMLWFFEGFVVELLRTAFNATETSDLRNRTVYFRQDDWVALCKPQWAKLIQSTFERLDKATAETILASRKLGYSFVRLLPKETGVRPIMNLQMKPKKKVGNELKIGKSINRVLRGTFHALTYEKNQPRKTPLLGAAVTGPGDIYTRMKGFKLRLLEGRKSLPELFFVKVDVRACYDTIKQEKLLAIVQKILDNGDETYRIESHEVVSRVGVQTRRQWPSKASAENTRFSFPERAAELAEDNRYAVFSDKIFYFTEEARDMQQYLREHVTNNLVKIGSRFYRQKDGIPQGSILSGLLCNLFYGNMEQANLAFTNDSRSLLLRYIDDFMFITADKSLALRFLEVMSKGIPEYGCFVSPEKGLTNFDASIDGVNMMPKLSGKDFPFCGMLVNTVSLEVKAETARYEDIEMADKLSVERHKRPGTAFLMKMLKECKRRTHPIYTDTSSFNKISTAYLNVYQSFLFVALKFRSYVHEWGADPRERVPFFRRVINQLVHFMYSVIKGQIQSKNGRKMGAACNMKPSTVSWLGYHAFHRLLLAKPMIYRPILKYLSKELRQGSRRHGRKLARHLDKVVKERTNAFAEGVAWRRKTL
ncbi:telomerase reverse transcriptase [Pseudohyphozyma bogoriensis]|nr:telomerase reverse transcriptase [Pseudohyphozyma bogoriensis]